MFEVHSWRESIPTNAAQDAPPTGFGVRSKSVIEEDYTQCYLEEMV